MNDNDRETYRIFYFPVISTLSDSEYVAVSQYWLHIENKNYYNSHMKKL